MNKFNILNVTTNIETESIIQKNTPSTSQWLTSFKDTKRLFANKMQKYKLVNSFLAKNDRDSANNLMKEELIRDVRTCPGFKNVFQKSYLLRLPVDLEMFIDPDEKKGKNIFRFNQMPYPSIFQQPLEGFAEWDLVDGHNAMQYTNDKKQSFYNGYVNLKIILPILYYTDKPTQFMFLDPFLHNIENNDHKVIPGVLESNKNVVRPIIIQMMFPLKPQAYYFKAGQPLAYMMCVSEHKSLQINENKYTQDNYTKFSKKQTNVHIQGSKKN